MMNKRGVTRLVLMTGLCVFPAAWSAQATVARIVKFRQAVMTVQAETFASLTAMVTGKTPYDPKRAQILSDRAETLAQITNETFPDSSRDAPGSQARPEIWSDRQGFEKMMADYLDKTTAVATAAKNDSAGSLRPATSWPLGAPAVAATSAMSHFPDLVPDTAQNASAALGAV